MIKKVVVGFLRLIGLLVALFGLAMLLLGIAGVADQIWSLWTGHETRLYFSNSSGKLPTTSVIIFAAVAVAGLVVLILGQALLDTGPAWTPKAIGPTVFVLCLAIGLVAFGDHAVKQALAQQKPTYVVVTASDTYVIENGCIHESPKTTVTPAAVTGGCQPETLMPTRPPVRPVVVGTPAS